PAVQVPGSQAGCPLDVPAYVVQYVAPMNQSCTPVGYKPAHLYQVEAFVGPNQNCYQLINGTCTAGGSASCPIIGDGTSQTGYATYAVSAELPATTFVASMPAHD
ncbi:MAG TPA: hypothetical protein VHB21_25595, partial [Minicystis sp.]|nr:hypothetical protein [Minicystis sp.]